MLWARAATAGKPARVSADSSKNEGNVIAWCPRVGWSLGCVNATILYVYNKILRLAVDFF